VTALETTGRSLSVAWRLAQQCRRLRPDLVHTRNWGTIDGIIGARLAGVPAVVHSEHGRDRATLPRRRTWALLALSPWVDAVVAVSEHLRRHLHSDVGIDDSKISVIRNGVDARRFQPVPDRAALRQRLGFEPGQSIVIAVGRLDPVKNYPLLIDAFSLVRQRAANALLVIVGDGPERARIEQHIAQRRLSSIVRLVGHRDDVEDWLAAADVFAHPSSFEGMANAALEAMAAGLPVVATRVGGFEEIVVDGVTGRLVACADENALAQALAGYCVDPETRAQHGNASRERTLREFSSAAMIEAYAGLYQHLLAARGFASATAATGQ
jgi:sugar transferase (PEP-CTERM/EpsH1 system associated)